MAITPIPSRTVVVPSRPSYGGVYLGARNSAPLWWPFATPTSSLDYFIDATDWLNQITVENSFGDFAFGASAFGVGTPTVTAIDAILNASLSVSPSGTGELVASNLRGDGKILEVNLTGGVAGRVYTVQVNMNTFAGYELTVFVEIGVKAFPGVLYYKVPPAPVPGYGTPITWQGNYLLGVDGNYLLGSDGNYLLASI